MKDLLEDLESGLEKLRSKSLFRSLADPQGIDFSTNDYLGLSQDPAFHAAVLERLKEGTTHFLRTTLPQFGRILRKNVL